MRYYEVYYPLSSMRDIRNVTPSTEFDTSKAYIFMSGDTFVPGDICLAEHHNGIAIVQVKLEVGETEKASRFILCRLNLEMLRNQIAWQSRKIELRRNIKKRLDEIDFLQRAGALADKDPELKEMLKELTFIDNSVKSLI